MPQISILLPILMVSMSSALLSLLYLLLGERQRARQTAIVSLSLSAATVIVFLLSI